ncbi:ankyrin repeat-containing domain protein [Aspergillus cavernicola]|uniref:Ankyrin repeat-containing domain protein n=1 Tax=Aspergillus cavernicola TaxID=176166 RepID=A0ABR4HTD0_9EURO
MADTAWESRKTDIERLYVQEDKNLSQVMHDMASIHGFRKTKARCTLTGFNTPLSKLSKAVYTKAFVSTIDKLSTAPSPRTPEGVTVCTPLPSGPILMWDISLPWLRFSGMLHPGPDQGSSSAPSTLTLASRADTGTVSCRVNPEVIERLSSIVPWRTLNHPPNINSTSRTAAALSILMPEESSQGGAFLLSNKLASGSAIERTYKSMKLEDMRVMEMFRNSCWNNIRRFETLLSSQEPTAQAIGESMFAAAMRLPDLDILYKLLHMLHIAYSVGVELINILLFHGADIHLSYNGQSALWYAIELKCEEATRVLLSHGAHPSPECLASAAWFIEDLDLFDELIPSCTDLNEPLHNFELNALGIAVLCRKIPVINFLLARGADVNARAATFPDINGISTTVLGYAVILNDQEVIKLLLRACTDVNVYDVSYVYPLAFAVSTGSTEVIELLLQAGADVRIADSQSGLTLVEHAAKKKNLELYQNSSALLVAVEGGAVEITNLLINMGVRLNEVYSRAPGTVLAAAIERGCLILIRMLEDAGARDLGPSLRYIGNLETAIHLQRRGTLQALEVDLDVNVNVDVAVDVEVEVHIDFLEPSPRAFPANYLKAPLEVAIEMGHLHLVEPIINRGAWVTDRALAAVHLLVRFKGNAPTVVAVAILKQRPDLLQLILGAGADSAGKPLQYRSGWTGWVKTSDPHSVLEIASMQPYNDTFPILLQSRPWEPMCSGRALARGLLVKSGEQGDDLLRMVEVLLEAAADANQEVTVHNGYWTGIEGNPRKDTEEPITSLKAAHAAENGNMELIDMLLDHGADIKGAPARDSGATALQIASIRGYLGIARRFIDLGAEVNAAPAEISERTALEGAAEHGHIDMLQMLLNQGAAVVGDNGERQYQRAVFFAERYGHTAAARLLKSFKQIEESLA